jgi:tetratricopeptide (TPR) repeat protein
MSLWLLLRMLWRLPGRRSLLVLIVLYIVDSYTLRLTQRAARRLFTWRRIRALERTIALNPHDRRSRAELGDLLVERGRFQRAVHVLKPALEADPGAADLLMLMGRACFGTGQAAQAELFLEEVRRIDAKYGLGSIDLELGRGRLLARDAAGSIEPLRRFCGARASTVEGQMLLSRALAASGDPVGAIQARRAAWEAYEDAPDFMRSRERIWAWRANPLHFVGRLAMVLAGVGLAGFALHRYVRQPVESAAEMIARRGGHAEASQSWVDEGKPLVLPAVKTPPPAVIEGLTVSVASHADPRLVDRLNLTFVPLAEGQRLEAAVPPLFVDEGGVIRSSLASGTSRPDLAELLRAYARTSAYFPDLTFAVTRAGVSPVTLRGGQWRSDAALSGILADQGTRKARARGDKVAVSIEAGPTAAKLDETLREALTRANEDGQFPLGPPVIKTRSSNGKVYVWLFSGNDSRVATRFLEVLQPLVCQGPSASDCPAARLQVLQKGMTQMTSPGWPLNSLDQWFERIDSFRGNPAVDGGGDDDDYDDNEDAPDSKAPAPELAPVAVAHHPELVSTLAGHTLRWRSSFGGSPFSSQTAVTLLPDGTLEVGGEFARSSDDGSVLYEMPNRIAGGGRLRYLRTGQVVQMSSREFVVGFDGASAVAVDSGFGDRHKLQSRLVRYSPGGTRTVSQAFDSGLGHATLLRDGLVAVTCVTDEASRLVLYSSRTMRTEGTVPLPERSFVSWTGELENGHVLLAYMSVARSWWQQLFQLAFRRAPTLHLGEFDGERLRPITDKLPPYGIRPAAVFENTLWIDAPSEQRLVAVSLSDGHEDPVELPAVPHVIRGAAQVGSRILLNAGDDGLWVWEAGHARKAWSERVKPFGQHAALDGDGSIAVLTADDSGATLHLVRPDGTRADVPVPRGSSGLAWDSGEVMAYSLDGEE